MSTGSRDPQLRWLRLWTDVVDDAKLLLLSPADRWYYLALLALKRTGLLDDPDNAETRDRKVGVRLRLDDRERDELRRRLVEARLIDEAWQPNGWKYRQFDSDSSTSRVHKFRRNQKRSGNVSRNDTETFHERFRNAPETETETEEEHGHPPSAFDRFWSAYPKKVKKKPAQELWRRKSLDRLGEIICADVASRPTSDDRWKAGYVPDPTTYLQQERWNDEIQAAAKTDGYRLSV